MQPEQAVSMIIIGCMFLALGLIPGAVEGLVDGIRNFSDSLSSPFPTRAPHRTESEKRPRHLGLALAGAALIVISLLAWMPQ